MKSWDGGTLIKDARVASGLFISVRFVGGNRVKYASLECTVAVFASRGQSTADLWPLGDDFIIQAVHPPLLRSPPPPHSRPTGSHKPAPFLTSRTTKRSRTTFLPYYYRMLTAFHFTIRFTSPWEIANRRILSPAWTKLRTNLYVLGFNHNKTLVKTNLEGVG